MTFCSYILPSEITLMIYVSHPKLFKLIDSLLSPAFFSSNNFPSIEKSLILHFMSDNSSIKEIYKKNGKIFRFCDLFYNKNFIGSDLNVINNSTIKIYTLF